MLVALIAVIGTLLGSVTTGLLQYRALRADRRTVRADQDRRERVVAVAALAAALSAHRRAMWVREDLRLAGAADTAYAAARAESHATRAALTGPLATLAILAPALTATAHEAAQATYDLRGAADRGALDAARLRAIDAEAALIAAAAA
ncbi:MULTISPECIES: hypothetical protein [Streptomyces]|uniref:Protein kilB n=1 Tax=Streptomyces tsukubensis (strain DSM 42081 / NBRC 108919 / NRRL 18488 / 9993) TaxID=1114943 RepID=I2N0Z9_STRT9|nr:MULTISPECIES: hypothetical protein [Streptomyces]AZK94862.1 protein kilB [Streptomyces tsukubensis]EIF90696.1 Protein kilB [Streptomyces tsukubensis NRRL18488]MYS66965.1 protein kilB [Streptomyces sp. SID5473]QKM69056.1 protein kilB [Streptomyces tsukubensis NRRL18488]TAI40722.1 protein kilB [Streptomyces tsukubensis]